MLECGPWILQKTTIDGETSQVLLDAGPEGLSIERNVKAMKVPLRDLDAIVLSHWHRDRQFGSTCVLSDFLQICFRSEV